MEADLSTRSLEDNYSALCGLIGDTRPRAARATRRAKATQHCVAVARQGRQSPASGYAHEGGAHLTGSYGVVLAGLHTKIATASDAPREPGALSRATSMRDGV